MRTHLASLMLETDMAFLDVRTLPEREPKPGWHGRFFDSEGMTFAYYDIDAGASLHEHSHSNEEVWNVVAGELEISIGGELFRAAAGSAALVPPNTAHSVRALAASSVIVVDAPLRAQVGGRGRAAFAIRFERFAGSIAYEIANHGEQQGVLRQVQIETGFAAALPASRRTEIPTGELPERIVIAGGAAQRASLGIPPLTAAQRATLDQGSAIFYVRGVVLYEDASGARHHTTFCQVLAADGSLEPPAKPGYNYGD
jgi:quercetin dioxygenase-like cupin family protein